MFNYPFRLRVAIPPEERNLEMIIGLDMAASTHLGPLSG
jgi:hypothetical protein